MVQFTSPQTEIRNPDSGKTKVRTPGRPEETSKPDKKGKSDFAETLKNEKVSREKERVEETSGKKSEFVKDSPAHKSEKNEVPQGKKTLRQHKSDNLQEKSRLAGFAALSEQNQSLIITGAEDSLKKNPAGPAGKLKLSGHSEISAASQSRSDKGKTTETVSVFPAMPQGNAEKSENIARTVSSAGSRISGAKAKSPDNPPLDASALTPETQAAGVELPDSALLKESQTKDRKEHNHSNPSGKNQESSLISVDDRRTVKTEDSRAVFSPVGNSDSKELVLEMDTGDDLTGTIQTGEGRDFSGKQFVLHSAEEQKGSFLLNKQLQEGGTRDLAKNIRFVLKDNNHGEIKLILKPEAMGKVRIHLNLEENNIVGKIIVENNSVKQVFQNNLADLSRALEESGFDSAALDVSVGGGESGPQQGDREEQPVYFHREASDLEDAVPAVYENGGSLSQIDLVI